MDVLCQAKSGMGKTAVFVLSVLQQLEPVAGQVAAVIICHTRELAFQVNCPCLCPSISLVHSICHIDNLLMCVR